MQSWKSGPGCPGTLVERPGCQVQTPGTAVSENRRSSRQLQEFRNCVELFRKENKNVLVKYWFFGFVILHRAAQHLPPVFPRGNNSRGLPQGRGIRFQNGTPHTGTKMMVRTHAHGKLSDRGWRYP